MTWILHLELRNKYKTLLSSGQIMVDCNHLSFFSAIRFSWQGHPCQQCHWATRVQRRDLVTCRVYGHDQVYANKKKKRPARYTKENYDNPRHSARKWGRGRPKIRNMTKRQVRLCRTQETGTRNDGTECDRPDIGTSAHNNRLDTRDERHRDRLTELPKRLGRQTRVTKRTSSRSGHAPSTAIAH